MLKRLKAFDLKAQRRRALFAVLILFLLLSNPGSSFAVALGFELNAVNYSQPFFYKRNETTWLKFTFWLVTETIELHFKAGQTTVELL